MTNVKVDVSMRKMGDTNIRERCEVMHQSKINMRKCNVEKSYYCVPGAVLVLAPTPKSFISDLTRP